MYAFSKQQCRSADHEKRAAFNLFDLRFLAEYAEGITALL
jgi:hypothetical protein